MQSLQWHYIIMTSSLEHFLQRHFGNILFLRQIYLLNKCKAKNPLCIDTVNNNFIASLQLKSTL